jgi:hypothetical protein
MAGNMLYESSSSPWHLMLGNQASNVSGPVVRPPRGELCNEPTHVQWRGYTILGGDWTSPGCSIETRVRIFQAAGAVAAVFVGTEGLPFDWDGSDRQELKNITAVVMNSKDYARLLLHVPERMASVHQDVHQELYLWLEAQDTPLLHSVSFRLIDRALQATFFLAAACNAYLGITRLHGFVRAQRMSRHLTSSAAMWVLSLELAASFLFLLFVVDGPGLEHTRPAVLPWIVDRMVLSLFFECHMLATLVLSSHLRFVCKRLNRLAQTDFDACAVCFHLSCC